MNVHKTTKFYVAMFHGYSTFGAKYSRMDQVKFVEDNL